VITNQDGTITVVGFPNLSGSATTRISVTVSQPYKSVVAYPLQFLGGSISETVAADTLVGQQ
jgi:hypothetical protein